MPLSPVESLKKDWQHRYQIRAVWSVCALSTLLMLGCANPPVTENVPPPRLEEMTSLQPQQPAADAPENVLDWVGTYQAVLPCLDCSGIAISVQLRRDRTAVVREWRMGEGVSKRAFLTYNGPFRFDPPGGSAIVMSLNAQAAPIYRFLLEENGIEMRARATGAALAESGAYRLRKTSMTPP